MPETLSYATPEVQPPSPSLYNTAIAFALVPMIVGLGCLLGFALLRTEFFVLLGLLTIPGGLVFVLVSLVLITIYWQQGRHAPGMPKDQLRQEVRKCAVLIILNFPMAAFCVFGGIQIVKLGD